MRNPTKIASICTVVAAALLGCDLATVNELNEEISVVQKKIDTVEEKQVTTSTEFAYAISTQKSRIDWVERRQNQTQEIMEIMGDGFNILTESIEETQKEARYVADQQRRLELKVANQFKPVLSKVFEQTDAGINDVVVLIGLGKDLLRGTVLETLRLILDDPPILRRIVGEDQYIEFIPTREVGNRIYGLSDIPEESICLEIIDRAEEAAEFTAVRCENEYQLYEFRVE